MQELWTKIPDFEDYEVSNTGKVRSISGRKGKWGKELKPLKHKYLRVCLNKANKPHWKSIHRLVALVYIPNPNNLPEVNHKNGDKYNNNDWNLEWCSHKGNVDHAYNNKLYARGENSGRAKLTEQQVRDIHNFLLKKVKTEHLAEYYGVSMSTIATIKTAIFWKHLNLPPVKTRGKDENKKLLYEHNS